MATVLPEDSVRMLASVRKLLGTCAPGALGDLRFLPTNGEWA